MDDKARKVYDYAQRRYHYDAEFHARVHHAVEIVRQVKGILSSEEEAVAVAAAIAGLAMEWVDPVTGRITDD